MIRGVLSYKIKGKTHIKSVELEGCNDYVKAVQEIVSQLAAEFDTMDVGIPTLHLWKLPDFLVKSDEEV